MKKPIIGITMGDPAGNGSEISVKALSRSEIYEQCRPVIIGDAACMEEAVKIAGKEGQIKIHAINDIKAAKFEYGTIDVYDMNLVNMDRHIFGKVSKMCGEAAFQYVVKVIELAQSGEIDATVTNALNKEAINMAGHHYSGHTEIYAPRGEAIYYVKANGSKFLTRYRNRTPTFANIPGLIETIRGAELADVAMMILTIDPCISCTER